MTPVHVTAAQARRLGLASEPTPRRTTRKEAQGPYATKCTTCGAEFTTVADEDRHVTLTCCRYELMLGLPMFECEECGKLTYDVVRHRCGKRQP